MTTATAHPGSTDTPGAIDNPGPDLAALRRASRSLVFVSDGTSGSDKVALLLGAIPALLDEVERSRVVLGRLADVANQINEDANNRWTLCSEAHDLGDDEAAEAHSDVADAFEKAQSAIRIALHSPVGAIAAPDRSHEPEDHR